MADAEAEKNDTIRHSIGVVSRRTGLKPDVIRAWEKRFGAVVPGRTATNRRFYTDEQIEKLLLLRQATLSGRQIGQVADLSISELRDLAAQDRIALNRVPKPGEPITLLKEQGFLASCLEAVEAMDAPALRYHLEKASSSLTQPKLMDELVIPLVQEIGNRWESGGFRIAHEHAASVAIRAFLENLQAGYTSATTAPSIVIGTPIHQYHELGALIACNTAAAEGWNIIYLGAALPAEEFVAVAEEKNAVAVALSLVYPGDDPYLPSELRKLRRMLHKDVDIITGGHGSSGYLGVLEEISALVAVDTEAFREILRQLRN